VTLLLGIVGGTGLTQLSGLEISGRELVQTPYGVPSGPLTHGIMNKREVIFLPRHGYGHTIPPHKINYRANMWALKRAGVNKVLAVAAVGGINPATPPGGLVVPDQIIDYTWNRVNTYFEEGLVNVTHIDFTQPYDEELRQRIIKAANEVDVEVTDGGTYAATQGPRLETAAEVDKLERDGCDIVGMTGMPEAALARELELPYAACAVVANHAAGRGSGIITMENIQENLQVGMNNVIKILECLVSNL